MREHAGARVVVSFGLLVATALTGCSGGSDVGDQDAPGPVAWAKALNQPFTGTNGDITVTARAGSEVFLTGKDSDGGELPVLNWSWTPANDAAQSVVLVTRNASTVSFTAPQTPVDQELRFRLTVANSNGVRDDATIVVNVVGVPDPDAFLQYDGPATFVVGAVASKSGALSSAAPAEVEFRITVERRVTYWDLQGQRHADVVLGSEVLDGAWLKAYGTSTVCGAPENPRFELPLPTLDADDVLAKLSPSPADQAQAPDPSRIDDAEVSLRIAIELLDPLVDREAGVCVLDADSSAVTVSQQPRQRTVASAVTKAVSSETIVPLDDLAGAADTTRDTRASARAYYATIDPDSKKDTLSKWLAETGFTDGTTSWAALESGSSAHAVYLNNYDLGFGRDMYMRFGACDSGAPPALGQPVSASLAGTCDVYAVVINYPSLEAAAKKTGALLAVAMEYSRLPGGGATRATTFYTFAPDNSGVFKRVLSANLDGRGERYLPQACTVCHGGTPQGVVTTSSGSGQDVPLDVDGDGVPDAYRNGGNVNAGFMSFDLDSFLYSDTDPAFSNAGDPYFPDEERALAQRHTRAQQKDGLRRLNQMAYLTYADPAPGRFEHARKLIESWYGGPGLPSTEFSSEHPPAGWDTSDEARAVYKDVFAQYCRACHVMQVPASGNQWAVGGYDTFATASGVVASMLGDGLMPFARLTMDRMWASPTGAKLQEHLVDLGNGFERPGTATWCIRPEAIDADRHAAVTFDASCSQFVDTYVWTVEGPSGESVPLLGARTASPMFVADAEGTYQISLGDATGPKVEATATVAKAVPHAGSTSTPLARQLPASGSLTFDVDVFEDLGSQSRDAIEALLVTGVQGVSAAPSPADPARKLRITVSTLSPGLATVTYNLRDIDGDVADDDGLIELDIGAALTVSNRTIEVDANGQASLNLATLVSGVPAGQALGYEITSPPTLARSRGAGSVSLTGSAASYVAPKGVSTKVAASGIVLPPGELDAFVFRVYFQNRPTSGASGTVRADLLAQQPFSQVAAELRARCTSCHAAQQEGSALVMRSTDTDETLYCAITTGQSVTGGPGTEPSGTSYVALATPAQSLVYRKVGGEFSHGGGNVAADAGFDRARLLAWIDEGGYYTGSTTAPTCSTAPPPNIGTPVAGSTSLSGNPIAWLGVGQRSRDIDVTSIAGTANAVVISEADLSWTANVSAIRKNSLTLTVTLESLSGAPGKVGEVRYRVKNLTGALSAEGVIDVYGTAELPSLTTTQFDREVAVNASTTTVLSSLTAVDKIDPVPSGLSLDCRGTVAASLPRNPLAGTGAAATSTVSCSAVTYLPPGRTQTKFGSVRFRSPDAIKYRICYTGTNLCSGEATVSVDVAGTRSFAGVYGVTSPGCTGGCHEGPTLASGRWTRTSDGKSTWCSIRAGDPRVGTSLVDIASPTSAPIYTVPQNGLLTDNTSHSTRTSEAATILAWLQEGGYYTESTSQACP